MGLRWHLAAVAALLPCAASAQAPRVEPGNPVTPGQNTVALPDVEVVGATPVQGSGLDQAKVPANGYVLRRADVTRDGPPQGHSVLP